MQECMGTSIGVPRTPLYMTPECFLRKNYCREWHLVASVHFAWAIYVEEVLVNRKGRKDSRGDEEGYETSR